MEEALQHEQPAGRQALQGWGLVGGGAVGVCSECSPAFDNDGAFWPACETALSLLVLTKKDKIKKIVANCSGESSVTAVYRTQTLRVSHLQAAKQIRLARLDKKE